MKFLDRNHRFGKLSVEKSKLYYLLIRILIALVIAYALSCIWLDLQQEHFQSLHSQARQLGD